MSENSRNTTPSQALATITKTRDLYENGLNSNFEFIQSVFKEGRLEFMTRGGGYWQYLHRTHANSEVQAGLVLATESTFSHFRSMVKTLQEVYPDNWDISLFYNPVTKRIQVGGFILHFGKMRIVNSNRNEHIMRGVYAFLPLGTSTNSNNFLWTSTMMMTRQIQTPYELSADYFHSHVSGGSIRQFQGLTAEGAKDSKDYNPLLMFRSMCLGDTSQGIGKACSDFNRDHSNDAFINVLLNVRSNLRYESLEGGPHRKMANIPRSRGGNTRRPSAFSHNMNSNNVNNACMFLMRHALQEDPSLLLRFDVSYHPFLSKTLTFQDNLKLEQVLENSFRKLVKKVPDQNSMIAIASTSAGNAVTNNIDTLSKLFMLVDGLSQGNNSNILPEQFYMVRSDDDFTREPADIVLQNYGSAMKFRGVDVPILEVEPHSGSREVLTGIDSETANIKISPVYLDIFKQTLIQKLTKNAFIQKVQEGA